jgi:deoxycytidine triphosphate deaminase
MKGILPHQELVALIPDVIIHGDVSCVRTASYDMRIGGDYYLYDEKCANGTEIRARGTGVISIPPNGLLLCTMHESLKLPADMVGHLSLKLTLLMKGIIIASQSQIDAGYEGRIFGLLYNLSQKDVCLKDGEFVLRLELVRLDGETDKPYNNSISKTASLSSYLDTPLLSSLVEIRNDASRAVTDVAAAKEKLSLTQLIGVVVGVIITLVSAVAGFHFAADSKVDRIEQKVIQLETKSAVADAAGSARARIEEIERQNKLISERLDKMEATIRSESPQPAHPLKNSSTSEATAERPSTGASK